MSALLGGSNLDDYPECGQLSDLVQMYYDIMILLQQAGAPASPPALGMPQVSCLSDSPTCILGASAAEATQMPGIHCMS